MIAGGNLATRHKQRTGARAVSQWPISLISCARADVERARPIAEALQAHGWDVWWDMSSLRAGQSSNKSIRASLGQAKCVVVLGSETSVESRWVEADAYFAWDHDKLASVVLDKSLRPPVPFNTSHAQDLSGWSGDTAAPAYRKLVADLTETVGPPAGNPVPPAEGASADTAEGSKSPPIAPKDADVSAKVESPIDKAAPAAGSPAPDWASAGGSDRYGRWAELSIPRKRKLQSFARTGQEPVIQRLRWIEPGSFQMGSPEDEPERMDTEGPRHEVRIAAVHCRCNKQPNGTP